MNFLKQINKGKTDWWRWLIILAVFVPSFLKDFLKSNITNPILATLPKTKNISLALNLSVYIILLTAFILVFQRVHKRSVITLLTGRKKFDWFRFAFSFSIWGIITMVALIISMYFDSGDYVWNFNLLPFLGLLAICLFLKPFEVVFVDILFKGYLLQGSNYFLKKPWLSLLLVILATTFITHLANSKVFESVGYQVVIYYVLVNVFLGLFIVLDDGLEISLGMKTVNNLIFTLFTTSRINNVQTESVLFNKTNSSLFAIMYFSIFIGFPVFFYFLNKMYKWSDWKEKLFEKKEIGN